MKREKAAGESVPLRRLLVAGLGNEILTDDGIGAGIVRFLERSYSTRGVDFTRQWLGGLEMLEYIPGYREVVFIDAMKTGEGKAGEISYFLPEHFRETLHLSNVHDLDFCTALALGRKLEYAMPREILVIAVEITEDKEFGRGYSPEIKRLFLHICRQIITFLFPVLQGEMTLAGRIMMQQDLIV